MHPACGGGGGGEDETLQQGEQRGRAEILADQIERVAAGEVDAITTLFDEFSGVVSFDQEQGALQIRGCAPDIIVANLPLTVSQRNLALAFN